MVILGALAVSSGTLGIPELRAQDAGAADKPTRGIVQSDISELRTQITTLLEQGRFAEVEELTRQMLVRSAELTQLAIMATALNTRLREQPADAPRAKGRESSKAEPERSAPPSASADDTRGLQEPGPDAEAIPALEPEGEYGGNIQLDLIQLADAYNESLENHEVAQLQEEESRRLHEQSQLTDSELRLAHVRYKASERKLTIVRKIMETAIGTAESDLRSVSADYEWRKRLRVKGYIAAEDLEASQRQVQAAKTRLEILRAVVGTEQPN